MHQHPRPPPASASPSADQHNPTRTNNPRDRDVHALRTNTQNVQGSGSSEDFVNNRQDQPATDPAAQMQRLNQVIQNFHTKAALIILHSRVDLAPAYSKNTDARRVNKWFNIELDETEEYKEDIKRWRSCDVKDERPPPLIIEVLLTTDALQQGQRLVILDEDGKRWDVMNALSSSYSTRAGKRRASDMGEITLERWLIELGDQSGSLPPDLSTILPLVYKKSIVLFRSLFTYCNFLPAWKLGRKIGKSRSTMALKFGYRIVDGSAFRSSRADNLNLALTESTSDVTTDYSFGTTDSPAGPFSVRVTYRQNCDFRIDDSEELLSSRFLGADEDLFRPSMPGERDQNQPEIGSLPNDHRHNLYDRPELGHAYGSLSTFHQVGFQPGTSPVSALRNAQDYSGASPPTPEPVRPAHPPQASQTSRNSLRAQAAGRRSSFSTQPFKAPTLSASPLGASPLGSSPRTQSGHVPSLTALTEETGRPPPNAPAVAARKPSSLVSEHAVASSASTSPKPTPGVRYSSSFSHRRARLSSGAITTKTDDDQTSSGRASAASSAQPGSGLITEAPGTSSGSMQEDDENIKDFIKLLDSKKDLLAPEDATAAEAATRRTAAALNRFHRMRDSNAALSDSMSSSLMLHRSSTSSSRQLSSVPPMVAATSASTSSSPGKPVSPHTPHTPFAPSRLSAAYSHDDPETHHLTIEEEPPSPSEAATSDTAQARSTTNVPAIDIPNSPLMPLVGYRRSSSAQRRRTGSEDDVGDLYGMRSASMDAHDRRVSARGAQQGQDRSSQGTETGMTLQSAAEQREMARPHTAAPALGDVSDSSARSSAHVYRSRLTRGYGRRVTPPQGSTSSFDRSAGDSGGSASGSWARGGGSKRGTGVRERPSAGSAEGDEDEFLPFAMEKSDFQTSKE